MSQAKSVTASQAKEMAAVLASLGEANAIEWDCVLACKRIQLMEVLRPTRIDSQQHHAKEDGR